MNALTIQLLGREYQFACPVGEEHALQEAARYFNSKMEAARGTSRVTALDRVAIMAGLNIAHELLTQTARDSANDAALRQRLNALQARIDCALDKEPSLPIQPLV